ncbi:UPF0415 protein C7orf25 [Clarias magur]|uniref:UPF0415 protein C7orf25 n=1 Tax=Clarias magur TaxID=1594786 RepID=A0A8J4TKC8_CLAMG|nr:UPF0415 protein C7orf25 [Clarias magur]
MTQHSPNDDDEEELTPTNKVTDMASNPMLQECIKTAEDLLKRVDLLCSHQNQEVEGRAKLCSKLRAELKFLQK